MDNTGIEVECPLCEGQGCDECEHGYFALQKCPQEFVQKLRSTIHVADLFAKGFLPVSGGTLDQSASFLAFARQLEYEDNLAKTDG